MPNTTVRAAAEGLPSINRRKALAATGTGLTAALVGLATPATPAPTAEPECPWARVHRLCRELGQALKHPDLDGWSAQVFSTAMWLHQDDREDELRDLMAAHADALRAFLDGPDETAVSKPLCDAELAAFNALLAYPCTSFQMVHTKARYLLQAWPVNGSEFPAETATLLRSLLAYRETQA